MKTSTIALLSSLILSVKCLSQCIGGGSSVATSYSSNNGSRGAMFDLTATNDVTILCFDANIYNTVADYEIYYKAGSYVGYDVNPAAWTLVGGATVSSLGPGLPSPLLIPVNVFIPAGQTFGFYVTNTINGGVNYTSSATQGVTLAADANLTMVGGVGKTYPFLTTFNYRLFNGTVHYVPGLVSLPVGLTNFFATPLGENVRLNWQTETELNNDHFTVERSADALQWDVVQTVKGSGTSNKPVAYELLDQHPLAGISYYRLSQTDINGHTTYFDLKSIDRKPVPSSELVVYPNPAENEITISGTADELQDITVFDLFGQNISEQVVIHYFNDNVTIDLPEVKNTVVIVHCGERSALVFRQ